MECGEDIIGDAQESMEITESDNLRERNVLPPPSVLWAQRSNVIYLTVALEDCKNPIIQVDSEMLYFKGVGGTDQTMHEVTVEFFKPIDPIQSKLAVHARAIEFALEKTESGYWERLLKSTTKQHWLKVNFNKWKDEDDSNCDEEGNLENLSWNSLVESLRQSRCVTDPLAELALQNEELSDAVDEAAAAATSGYLRDRLDQLMNANRSLEVQLARKQFELHAKETRIVEMMKNQDYYES